MGIANADTTTQDTHTYTITDDDTTTLAVNDVTVTEGTDAHAIFTVSIDNVTFEDISFSLALADNTATGVGTDYGTAGTDNIQVFSSGAWNDATSGHHSGWGKIQFKYGTPITDDALDEADEDFTLTATVTGGTTTNADAHRYGHHCG